MKHKMKGKEQQKKKLLKWPGGYARECGPSCQHKGAKKDAMLQIAQYLESAHLSAKSVKQLKRDTLQLFHIFASHENFLRPEIVFFIFFYPYILFAQCLECSRNTTRTVT